MPTPLILVSIYASYGCGCHRHNPSTEMTAEKPGSYFSVIDSQPHQLCAKVIITINVTFSYPSSDCLEYIVCKWLSACKDLSCCIGNEKWFCPKIPLSNLHLFYVILFLFCFILFPVNNYFVGPRKHCNTFCSVDTEWFLTRENKIRWPKQGYLDFLYHKLWMIRKLYYSSQRNNDSVIG